MSALRHKRRRQTNRDISRVSSDRLNERVSDTPSPDSRRQRKRFRVAHNDDDDDCKTSIQQNFLSPTQDQQQWHTMSCSKFLPWLFCLSLGYGLTLFYQIGQNDNTLFSSLTSPRIATANHAMDSKSPAPPLPDSIVDALRTLRSNTSKPILKGTGRGSIINLSQRHGAIYLHPGKAAGGTFVERFMNYWKIQMFSCHPYPCEAVTRHTNILISVRDPVDRFVSGFNWLRLTLCNPFNETRYGRQSPPKNWASYCKSNRDLDIAYLVHNKYAGEPNQLAESLCSSEDCHGQSGVFAFEEAIHDMLRLDHLRHSYRDWLSQMTTKNTTGIYLDTSGRNISTVILEHGFDLLSQIDSTLKWVAQTSENSTRALEQHEKAQAEKGLTNPATWLKQVPDNTLHTTSKLEYPVSTYLSKLGQCCVTRWYRDDYQILLQLQEYGCHGDTAKICQQAIASIYERRKLYLEDTTKSCHELATI